jgi:hypothetical protein
MLIARKFMARFSAVLGLTRHVLADAAVNILNICELSIFTAFGIMGFLLRFKLGSAQGSLKYKYQNGK